MADQTGKFVQIPEGQTAPDGYRHVFGPVWIAPTALQPVDNIKKAFSEVDFTNPSCEAAMAALKSVSEAAQQALAVPKQLMSQAKKLLDSAAQIVEAPFSSVQEAVNSAFASLDAVNKAVDDLVSGASGPLSDAKKSLEKMLECPVVAGTPMGQTIEDLLDAMDNNSPIKDMVDDLKKQLGSQVSDQLEALKETPLGAIRNMQGLMDDTLERLNVSDLINKMQALEECVAAACDMAKVAARLPESAENTLKSIGGKIDEATGKVKSAVMDPKTTAQNAVADTVKKIDDVTSRIKSPVVIRM